jgi:hypothetical protein
MKKICFLVAAILCTINVFAQKPGYVITQSNDTIKCEVKNVFNMIWGDVPKYVIPPDTNLIKIKIKNIKEYQFTKDSTIYIAKILPDDKNPTFVKWLIRGKIDLFDYTVKDRNMDYTTWYVSKNNGPLLSIKISGLVLFSDKKGRMASLEDMFGDDPAVLSTLKNANNLHFDTIASCIKTYDQDAKTSKNTAN